MNQKFIIRSIIVILLIATAIIAVGYLVQTPNPNDTNNLNPNTTDTNNTNNLDPNNTNPVTQTQNGFTSFLALDDSKSTPEGVNNLVSANNRFAIDLYNKLDSDSTNDGKNIFFSPFSIHTALGMTYEGADGTTAEQMRNVLNYSENDIERQSSFAKLFNTLYDNSKGNYQLNIANAIWNEQTFPFKQSFFDVIDNYYYGKSNPVDFINEPEKQRLTINKWVEDQTQQKIKDLLTKETVGPETNMILVNAIYFKGDWKNQFDVDDTIDAEFSISENEKVTVKMMNQTEHFKFFEDEGFKYIELPYSGENLSMIAILPEEYDFEIPDYETLIEAQGNMYEQEVIVSLPKFKFTKGFSVKDYLISMGMEDAFNDNANFSKMDETKQTYIGDVIHKAFVEVNEEGTEAAAATAVVIQKQNAMIPNYFVADQPFAFFIQDLDTKEILFMGKIVNPTNTA